MPSIRGARVPTGVRASNVSDGKINTATILGGIDIRVCYTGLEVGLVIAHSGNGIYWKEADFDRIIYELIKVRDAMKEEGLL